jgi:hypothetical protein
LSILTRVREHARRNAPKVREHVRGTGSRAAKFTGEYAGKGASKFKGAASSAKMSIFEKLREAKQAKKDEQAIREAVRAEEMAKAEELARSERLKRFTSEEKARAMQKYRLGPRKPSLFSKLVAQAKIEAKKELGYQKKKALKEHKRRL